MINFNKVTIDINIKKNIKKSIVDIYLDQDHIQKNVKNN